MKIGYYPGCSLLGSSREYDESIRAIAPQLHLDLEEIPDWNCCGASAAHNMNRELALALPARVLAIAEAQGMKEIFVPCSACFNRLAQTQSELTADDTLREEICALIEREYKGTVKIINILEVLQRIFNGTDEIKVSIPFAHKVVCYYGCYLSRPPKLTKTERFEDPLVMDDIVKKLGAEPIDWSYKTDCCGAGFSVSQTDIVAKLSAKIVNDAVKRGAEAIVVACPMCHSNFDMRRNYIDEVIGKPTTIPVLYITEVIGLALGIDSKKLGLNRHLVPVNL